MNSPARLNDSLPSLEKPSYALNCNFEKYVITNTCGMEHPFLDVWERKYRGSKWAIREELGIPTYGDPFDGDDLCCILEWHEGNYDDCLRHNRACLLIERDIQEHARGINFKKYLQDIKMVLKIYSIFYLLHLIRLNVTQNIHYKIGNRIEVEPQKNQSTPRNDRYKPIHSEETK